MHRPYELLDANFDPYVVTTVLLFPYLPLCSTTYTLLPPRYRLQHAPPSPSNSLPPDPLVVYSLEKLQGLPPPPFTERSCYHPPPPPLCIHSVLRLPTTVSNNEPSLSTPLNRPWLYARPDDLAPEGLLHSTCVSGSTWNLGGWGESRYNMKPPPPDNHGPHWWKPWVLQKMRFICVWSSAPPSHSSILRSVLLGMKNPNMTSKWERIIHAITKTAGKYPQ